MGPDVNLSLLLLGGVFGLAVGVGYTWPESLPVRVAACAASLVAWSAVGWYLLPNPWRRGPS